MSTPRERPILFSSPMVRAILDGRKTQTRRAMKPQPPSGWFDMSPDEVRESGEWGPGAVTPSWLVERCPHGKPGDRLWVRETWWRGRWTEEHHYNDIDGLSRSSVNWCYHKPGDSESIAYVADGDPPGDRTPAIGDHDTCEGWDKMPSIFLSRLDSRITLEITEVRVQRLQNITEDDARAEGVSSGDAGDADLGGTAYGAFHRLWDEINSKRSPWASNPWVWAIAFRRLLP